MAVIIFPIEWLERILEKKKIKKAGYPFPYKVGITKTVLFRAFCLLSSEQKNAIDMPSEWELFLPGDKPCSLLLPEATCVFVPEEAPDGIDGWSDGDWIAENSGMDGVVRLNLSARIRGLESRGVTAYVLLSPDTRVETFAKELPFFRLLGDGALSDILQ